MRVAVQGDRGAALNLTQSIKVLNLLCKSVRFEKAPSRQIDSSSSSWIEFEEERDRLLRYDSKREYDLRIYVSARAQENNYFFYVDSDVAVLSLFGWRHLTPLPLENGFVYFVARFLAYAMNSDQIHDENTGCLNDFLRLKTGIDRCLRMAHVCDACRACLDPVATDEHKALYEDIGIILDAVSNTSRWGKSVLEILSDHDLKDLNWSTFETLVADYYREIGGEVTEDTNLAGFQVDVLVRESTASGLVVRSVVECKFYKEKVGNRVVNDFARVVATMKEAGLADSGVIVSYAGFTQDAQLAASHAKVKLVHYKDLRRSPKPGVRGPLPHSATAPLLPSSSVEPAEIFVIMPFSSGFDDLYHLGIHGAISELGEVCTRLDQVAFTGGILDELQRRIRSARIIIAEVTEHNPNVFYELGYADALGKPVVLLTSDISRVPFDISGFNHLVYVNIRDLKAKLAERLRALLRGNDLESK